MPSFFPHAAKTQNHQSDPAEAAQEPMVQSIAQQEPKPKGRQTAALEILLPAHENTPITAYAVRNAKCKIKGPFTK